MARRAYWLCKCGYRNERTHRNCRGPECNKTRPKKRVPKHAESLRDIDYETWARLSQEIHGGELYACGVCGRLPSKTRRHDRDHDHRADSVAFGKPRGITDARCNRELLRNATLAEAFKVLAYLIRVEIFYLRQIGGHQTEEGGRDEEGNGAL